MSNIRQMAAKNVLGVSSSSNPVPLGKKGHLHSNSQVPHSSGPSIPNTSKNSAAKVSSNSYGPLA